VILLAPNTSLSNHQLEKGTLGPDQRITTITITTIYLRYWNRSNCNTSFSEKKDKNPLPKVEDSRMIIFGNDSPTGFTYLSQSSFSVNKKDDQLQPQKKGNKKNQENLRPIFTIV